MILVIQHILIVQRGIHTISWRLIIDSTFEYAQDKKDIEVIDDLLE